MDKVGKRLKDLVAKQERTVRRNTHYRGIRVKSRRAKSLRTRRYRAQGR